MYQVLSQRVLGMVLVALSPVSLSGNASSIAEGDPMSAWVKPLTEAERLAGDGPRDGECLTGIGCSNFEDNYPPGTFSTTSSDWTIVDTAIWPGDYAFYSVEQGFTYEWTLCTSDGAVANYDTQLTLRHSSGSPIYCYSDDYPPCGLQSKIRWTATFTGTVLVLVSKFYCDTDFDYTTLLWRQEGGGAAQPDLAPHQPAHWNDKVPIGITPLSWDATHDYSGPYYSNQTLYFNWASGNFGNASASNYTVRVEITGYGISYAWGGFATPAGSYTPLSTDQNIGPLSVGPHTFKLWLDYDSEVDESDETNNYYERTIEVLGVGGSLVGAVSRKSNPSGPGGVCELPIDLVPGGTITSDSRQGGITEVVLTYDAAPASGAVTLAHDPTCPGPPSYAAYTGGSSMSCVPSDNVLTCTFTPGLENAHTYQLTVPHGAGTAAVEIRGLIGDVNSDGFTNALDRGALIGAWTGATGFTCATDLNRDGSTNALDRGILIGAWTGAQNCAP